MMRNEDKDSIGDGDGGLDGGGGGFDDGNDDHDDHDGSRSCRLCDTSKVFYSNAKRWRGRICSVLHQGWVVFQDRHCPHINHDTIG